MLSSAGLFEPRNQSIGIVGLDRIHIYRGGQRIADRAIEGSECIDPNLHARPMRVANLTA